MRDNYDEMEMEMEMEKEETKGRERKGEAIHGYIGTLVLALDGRFMFTLEGSDIGTSDL